VAPFSLIFKKGDMMQYTVEQVKKAKIAIESNILSILQNFEKEYKIKVRNIDMQRKEVRTKDSKNKGIEVGPINWEATEKQPLRNIDIRADFLELMS